MTRTSSSPAPRKLRSLLARLLSDYATESGYDAALHVRRKQPTKAAAKSPRGKDRGRPRPDLVWRKRGKPLWKFFLLPGERVVRDLCGEGVSVRNAVICCDAAGTIGLIDPEGLLHFLMEHFARADRKRAAASLGELPEFSAPAREAHFTGTVRDNREFVPDHFSLRIQADFAQRPVPGQFLQIMCDSAPHVATPRYRAFTYSDSRLPRLKGAEVIERRPFLRRPFSIASYRPLIGGKESAAEEKWLELVEWPSAEFEIIYRRVPDGPGTGALTRYRRGEPIDIVGPLGNGYVIEPTPETALLVGGGIGAPPLLFLAGELKRLGCDVRVFLGALTRDRIPFHLDRGNGDRIERFERMGIRPVICTDDGSTGRHGLVTEAVVEYLERRKSSSPMKLFACGPRPLLSALNGIAERFRLPCEALLEERMACGFGACISCVCAVKEPGQKAHFTRICTRGPAFDVNKVMWHA